MWRVLFGGMLLLSAAGCFAEELTANPTLVCEEIGRTIANVSWACGTKLDVANQRGRDFIEQHQCTGPSSQLGEYQYEAGLACPVAMAHVPCDVARAAGDDFAIWIAAVPACNGIVVQGGAR